MVMAFTFGVICRCLFLFLLILDFLKYTMNVDFNPKLMDFAFVEVDLCVLL
jgi:hypothetical protein